MPKLDIHDVIRLKVDLVDIDDGLGDGDKVTLKTGETGTIMMMNAASFLVEFCNGADTKALITVKRENCEPA